MQENHLLPRKVSPRFPTTHKTLTQPQLHSSSLQSTSCCIPFFFVGTWFPASLPFGAPKIHPAAFPFFFFYPFTLLVRLKLAIREHFPSYKYFQMTKWFTKVPGPIPLSYKSQISNQACWRNQLWPKTQFSLVVDPLALV